MSRRALTLFLASLLAVGLAFVGAVQRVPYVVLSPGPAFNTLGTDGKTPVLTIRGHRTYATDGELDLTTVSVLDGVTLSQALRAWFSRSEAVVPRELLYPPDKDKSEADAESQQEMSQSHDDATTAALREVGIPGTTLVAVGAVAKGQPADGVLKAGDVLLTVDGKPVTVVARLRQLLNVGPPGTRVLVGYRRGGKADVVQLVTAAAKDDPKRAVLGITADVQSDFPVKVDIQLKDVGGPSAGLMFALGIVDKLEPGSLTGGRHVAGTGEIRPDGTVGAIGGVAQKMRGALAAGATVFLVPDGNCAEAKGSRPKGLQLIRVSTLKGALGALATLRTGGSPPSC